MHQMAEHCVAKHKVSRLLTRKMDADNQPPWFHQMIIGGALQRCAALGDRLVEQLY
jgi:hypothetical protein